MVSLRFFCIVKGGYIYIDQRKCVVNVHVLFVDSGGDF